MSTHETPAEYEASADVKQSAHESEAFEISDAAKVAAVAAVLKRLESCNVDHRHEDEKGAASPFGIDGRAYYYAGDIVDLIYDFRQALTDPDAALERVRAEARAEALRDAVDAQSLYGAWEEGWKAGLEDARGRTPGLHANPYRTALRTKAVTPDV